MMGLEDPLQQQAAFIPHPSPQTHRGPQAPASIRTATGSRPLSWMSRISHLKKRNAWHRCWPLKGVGLWALPQPPQLLSLHLPTGPSRQQ